MEQDNHILISRKFTYTELAEMIGASRESVNRMLNEMKKSGVVDFDNGVTYVTAVSSLRLYARIGNTSKYGGCFCRGDARHMEASL